MPKIQTIDCADGRAVYLECPGCGLNHLLHLAPAKNPVTGASWVLSGTEERPTLRPSVLQRVSFRRREPQVCHFFLTDGRLEFLGDCSHKLRGQVVALDGVDDGEAFV